MQTRRGGRLNDQAEAEYVYAFLVPHALRSSTRTLLVDDSEIHSDRLNPPDNTMRCQTYHVPSLTTWNLHCVCSGSFITEVTPSSHACSQLAGCGSRWQMGFVVVVKRDPYKSPPLHVTLSEVLTFSVTRMLSYILLLRTSLCQEQAKGKRINTGITRTLAQRLLGLSPYGVSPSLTSAGPFELHPVTS